MIDKVGVPFKAVTTGKLRRYFSWENFKDAFRVPVGVWEALCILRKFKADLVFSKGGYVSVPVVFAAWLLRVPVIVHESDVVPGLANKLCFRVAREIFVSFEETMKHLSGGARRRARVVGNPVRRSVLEGDAARGLKFTGLNKFRPVILVMGGSQGAEQINKLVEGALDDLVKKFQIVHIRGRGNLDISLHKDGYVQYEFLNEELKDIYSACELIISRGGASSLSEIAALGKKAVIIPLGTHASRGDQIENTKVMAKQFAWTVLEGKISRDDFVESIKMTMKNAGAKSEYDNGTEEIVKGILKYKK